MDGKIKISFGIKTSKQGSLPKKAPVASTDVEYISSFDSTCKPMSSRESPKSELVIPSKANKIGKDFLEGVGKETAESGGQENGVMANSGSSLEQQAAQELIRDAQGSLLKGEGSQSLELLLPSEKTDASEATLEDYESVPVQDFGKAMLRGMGWEPGKGIGKNQRVIMPTAPQLRPKGMGLGADKLSALNQGPQTASQKKDGEEMVLTIGCGAQVVAGGYQGLYGKVVSHNEDTGRCVVKLEIGGSSVSVNENLLKPVSKEDYGKNCRVLNAAKYKKYKESSDERLRKLTFQEEVSFAREAEVESPDSERSLPSNKRPRDRSRSPHI